MNIKGARGRCIWTQNVLFIAFLQRLTFTWLFRIAEFFPHIKLREHYCHFLFQISIREPTLYRCIYFSFFLSYSTYLIINNWCYCISFNNYCHNCMKWKKEKGKKKITILYIFPLAFDNSVSLFYARFYYLISSRYL